MSVCLPIMQRAGVPSRQMTAHHSAGVKRVGPQGVGVYTRQLLPTDAIGTATVTFAGIVAGSEVHVYLPSGVEMAGVESCAADQQLAWPVYAPGSPNNLVFITIIKRGRRWLKFPYQSSIGAFSLPIFQSTDLGYNNPA